jgi:SAM-dependent methyltransferase
MPTYFLAPTSYHEGSAVTQRSDMTAVILEKAGIGSATCVLDIGCGAGQTLRVVQGLNDTALLIGVDPDEESCRGGHQESGRIHFLIGEGERLPFPNESVSHAICRVAINYMHQASALREMARVLTPGGKIVLSFIGFGYSLREALAPHRCSLRQRLGNFKDLVAGVLLQALGYQGSRGSFWGRSVPYTSVAWLRRQLQDLDCTVTWLECEGRFLGIGTIWWAIISKTEKPVRQGMPSAGLVGG